MKEKIYIDVREADEYQAQHIPNSLNIPLSKLDQLKNYRTLLEGKPVYLVCKSGRRAGMAKPTFDAHNIECEVYDGGIERWESQAKPLIKSSRTGISIFRQVQIIVGGLVALFAVLAATIHPAFIWVTAALGTALSIAGIFGFCLLAQLLQKMPWNRVKI